MSEKPKIGFDFYPNDEKSSFFQIECEYYYCGDKVNPLYHREDGPALIYYYRSGEIRSTAYYLNDNIHNENGPAYLGFTKSGKIKTKLYYYNDCFVDIKTNKQFEKYIKALCIK